MKRARNLFFILLGYTNRGLFCILFNTYARVIGAKFRFVYDPLARLYVCSEGQQTRRVHMPKLAIRAYKEGLKLRGNRLAKAYLIRDLEFLKGDLVLDCGANLGDLKLWFEDRKLDVRYIGFEPSPKEFECLTVNVHPSQTENVGLWFEDGELDFYVSSDETDSSLIEPKIYTHKTKIGTKRLDEIIGTKTRIKLLKLEAEGAEPEVLRGCSGLLQNIDYISADMGPERGPNEENTVPDCFNFLIKNGFICEKFTIRPRVVALFKNSYI